MSKEPVRPLLAMRLPARLDSSRGGRIERWVVPAWILAILGTLLWVLLG